jgi:O-antigen/teichoic acid export membrane protein
MSTRQLFRDTAIYGAGDVATAIVNFLLIPVYTRVLPPDQMGVFALLLTLEALAKILMRSSVDSSFMRLYYDCRDDEARQTLASTIWAIVACNAPLFVAAFAASAPLTTWLFGSEAYTTAFRVFLVNTFIIGFYFIPFHIYRIEGRASRFAALTFTRAAGVLVLRLVFVVGLGWGVVGLVAADLVLTAVIGVAIAPAVGRLLRPRFSWAVAREALAFGLPRVPHGLAHQAMAMADRWVLKTRLPAGIAIDTVGIYSVGASLGLGLKLFLSAFEYAWAPFYLAAMQKPEAKAMYSRVTTYVVGLLTLLVAGITVMADDVVRVMAQPAYWSAAAVVPWVALGVLFQGVFQLTAIGLQIAKRTVALPLSTVAALAVAIGGNVLLVPHYGLLASAWMNTAAYGTLACLGFVLSQRVYPIAYEWRRLGVIAAAGAVAVVAALAVVPSAWPPVGRALARGTLVGGVFPAILAVAGFFRATEIAAVREAWRRRVQ